MDILGSYFNQDYYKIDGYDKEKARQAAIQTVMPLIIENELTKKQSICLRYKYFNNKNQNEIADILKLSQPTVSRCLNSAKDKVNTSLQYCYIALTKAIDEYDRLSNLN